MDSFDGGQAIPFITYVERQGFVLTKEAEAFLSSLPDTKLGVVSVVGKYRTGKSFFINRVLLNNKINGFNVGPTINPCTKGLWLWNKTIKCDNADFEDMNTLLIDTEGFGGVDENANHDTRIFLFSLLLSSFFIYNSVGSIDENALQNLSLIVNLAKEIQIKSKGQDNEIDDIAQYFPSFLWIVRDFALRLSDSNGNPINSKEYLENSLAPQKGVSDNVESKNRIRRLLKHFFKERDCYTMIRPLESEKDLQRLDQMADEEFRPDFVEQMRVIRKRIFKKIKPKIMNGKCLTGQMLIEITQAYLMAVNSGSVPNIENAWTYLCKQESHKAMEEAVCMVERKLEQRGHVGPMDLAEVKRMKIVLREELMQSFRLKSLGNESDLRILVDEAQRQFAQMFTRFKERNNEEWKKIFSVWLRDKGSVEEKLKSSGFRSYFEFQHEVEQLHADYEKNAPKGPMKERVWREYSEKMVSAATEMLIKQQEQESNSKEVRMMQRIEMLENEMSIRKRDFESEKHALYGKLQEVERDRAVVRSQESNLERRFEAVVSEKERLERELSDLGQVKREQEARMEREARERVAAVETRLESLKSEQSQVVAGLEKRAALVEQELLFTRREMDSLNGKVEFYDNENKRLRMEIAKQMQVIDGMREKMGEMEVVKQQEIAGLKMELEKKVFDLQNEADKRKQNLKQQSEWIVEKAYLENQVDFFKSQLEENKRLHDALLVALNHTHQKSEPDNTAELVETNKNLSVALDKMEMRCKLLEEKLEKLKTFKKMVKNATSMNCLHCNKSISCNIFLNHINHCINANPTTSQSYLTLTQSFSNDPTISSITSLPNSLQIIINQTIVKESADSKPYTEYLIQVTYEGLKFSVSRKYKDFCILHQELSNQFPTLKFPESAFTVYGSFTGGSYIGNTKRPVVIEERRKALQQYLRDLAKIEIVRGSEPFRKFLELERGGDKETGGKLTVESTMVTVTQNSQASQNSQGSHGDERLQSYREDHKELEKDPLISKVLKRNNEILSDEVVSVSQKELNVSIDKRIFSQSPHSFMRKWEETSARKENKQSNSKIHDINKNIDNLDVSRISHVGHTTNLDISALDAANDKSVLSSSKNDPSHPTSGPFGNLTSSFSPSIKNPRTSSASKEDSALKDNSTADKGFQLSAQKPGPKLSLYDLSQSQSSKLSLYELSLNQINLKPTSVALATNTPNNTNNLHVRSSASFHNTGLNESQVLQTRSLNMQGLVSKTKTPTKSKFQTEVKHISQKNFKNLKTTTLCNAAFSPQKVFMSSMSKSSFLKENISQDLSQSMISKNTKS